MVGEDTALVGREFVWSTSRSKRFRNASRAGQVRALRSYVRLYEISSTSTSPGLTTRTMLGLAFPRRGSSAEEAIVS
jgi:hypothetical protein